MKEGDGNFIHGLICLVGIILIVCGGIQTKYSMILSGTILVLIWNNTFNKIIRRRKY